MSTSPPETSSHGSNSTAQPSYFALSKLKAIVIIVAGVVMVGGLGAIASIAFGNPDQQPRGTSSPTEPGVDSPTDRLGSDLGSDGELSQGFKSSGRSVSADADEVEKVTIGSDVRIPVPRGWNVVFFDENEATLGNSKGTMFYALTSTTEATDALSVVDDVALKLLPEQLYTKVQRFPPSRLETVGTMISRVSFQYDATRTDLQASSHVYGYVSIGIRPDKKVLVLNAEHSPPKEWDKKIGSWATIHAEASLSFAGIEPE